MGQLENERHAEEAIARFEAESEAGKMVQRYQQQLREAQEAAIRNETSLDCE